MPNKLILKLRHGAPLSEAEQSLLLDAITVTVNVAPGEDIYQEGGAARFAYAVLDGFACRYKVLAGGERQILGILVPGDLCGLQGGILPEMDHGVGTLSACTFACIPHEAIAEFTTQQPGIARAFWWSAAADESIQRDWLANIAQRNAEERLAHLFCELRTRLDAVGLVDSDGSFPLPLTQEEIADTLGLSAVHVNRVLQQMRSGDRITFANGRLTIHDFEDLSAFGDFTPNYLYLDSAQGTVDKGPISVQASRIAG